MRGEDRSAHRRGAGNHRATVETAAAFHRGFVRRLPRDDRTHRGDGRGARQDRMNAHLVPGDDDDILAAIDRFVATVVVPLEEQHAAILTEPRARFSPSGSYSAEVLALKQQVRMASSRAGFYTLFSPTGIGGGGKGPL